MLKLPALLVLASLAAACGGSSSETPFPSAPDPSIFAPKDLGDTLEDAGAPRRKAE